MRKFLVQTGALLGLMLCFGFLANAQIIPDALSNQVVVVRHNKALFVNVETGLRNSNLVELTSGVNPGDSIIVSGMLFVRPNASVKVKKVVSLKEEIQ